MFNVKKSLILVLIGVFILVFLTTHSNAQGPPGHRKEQKKGWTGHTPPGWQKGEKRGWTKEEKTREKAREREALETQKEQEEALERGKSEEAKEMPVTKGKKGGKGKGKEKGKAWWKFWKREKKEAD